MSRTSSRATRAPGRGAHGVLLGLGTAVLLLVAGPTLLAFRAPTPVIPTELLARTSGLLAGLGVVVLVGLMSRAPWLERTVGADRLARWHSRGGRAVVLLILVHAVAAVVAWAGSSQVSLPVALWQVLGLPGLVAATLATGLFLAVAVVSVRIARRRVSYERWHAIHLLVYLAVALSFSHQLAGPDLVGHVSLQVLWALLYTSVCALVLQHRVLTPLRNTQRHHLRVSHVYREGPGVVSIVVAGRHLDELQAASGQFFRWRFLTPELWRSAHPFSLSAAPRDDCLRLTVKTLGDGSDVLQRVEPGTWVVAEGPYGAVTAKRRTRRDVLLVAGGVGVTSMRALFETMPLDHGQDLMMLYRARSEADVLFRDELLEIADRRGARVQFLLGDIGPLTGEMLSSHVPGIAQRDVYLCGPAGLTSAVRRALKQAGVRTRQLHEERFAL